MLSQHPQQYLSTFVCIEQRNTNCDYERRTAQHDCSRHKIDDCFGGLLESAPSPERVIRRSNLCRWRGDLLGRLGDAGTFFGCQMQLPLQELHQQRLARSVHRVLPGRHHRVQIFKTAASLSVCRSVLCGHLRKPRWLLYELLRNVPNLLAGGQVPHLRQVWSVPLHVLEHVSIRVS